MSTFEEIEVEEYRFKTPPGDDTLLEPWPFGAESLSFWRSALDFLDCASVEDQRYAFTMISQSADSHDLERQRLCSGLQIRIERANWPLRTRHEF